MVKAVVDLRRGVMLLDADLHADQEAELLAEGAAQQGESLLKYFDAFALLARRQPPR